MESHTVPRKLLEQFAYYDRVTRSKRLWRYEKGRSPFPRVSPRTATRIEGHFSHPDDVGKEQELETRLNREFEDPVNNFLFEITDPNFRPTDKRRRQLTFYVTLLFMRSEARRKASDYVPDILERACELFTENESQVLTVVGKWTLDIGGPLLTTEQVVKFARDLAQKSRETRDPQRGYLGMIENAMSHLDEKIFGGEWKYIRTDPSDPFVISDAPVITWNRMSDGSLSYGGGFHRPDVEVILPVSPVVCLHIQPCVERSIQCHRPTVNEVNAAQAAFATRACFSNVNSQKINHAFQDNFGKGEIGVKTFTLWHRVDTVIYEYRMARDGRSFREVQYAYS